MTPEEWRELLVNRLQNRQPYIARMERYYNGDHPLPEPPQRLTPKAFQEAAKSYTNMMRMGVSNWVRLVADAPAERLEVIGFRSGNETEMNQQVWNVWQENELDDLSTLVHDNAIQTGTSFVMVDPSSGRVTCEHSSQMIVAYEPGSYTDVAAALKLWQSEDASRPMTMVTLYLPGAVFKWQSENGQEFEPRGEVFEHPYPVMVTEFALNTSLKPTLYGGGMSEFHSVIPIQDRINKTTFDRLVTAEWQAFRQRYIIGWSPELDESTKTQTEVALMKMAQAMLWTFDADPEEVSVGELGQADFRQFIVATEADVNAMAAISKTPPHYLLGAMVNISGDALTAAETGLAAKTKKHARRIGAGWARVMRHAALVRSDVPSELADDATLRCEWADIENRSWAEQVDAALKMGSEQIGLPTEAVWEMLPNATPTDIGRWRAMKALQRAMEQIDGTTDEGDAEPGPIEDGTDGAAAA